MNNTFGHLHMLKKWHEPRRYVTAAKPKNRSQTRGPGDTGHHRRSIMITFDNGRTYEIFLGGTVQAPTYYAHTHVWIDHGQR